MNWQIYVKTLSIVSSWAFATTEIDLTLSAIVQLFVTHGMFIFT